MPACPKKCDMGCADHNMKSYISLFILKFNYLKTRCLQRKLNDIKNFVFFINLFIVRYKVKVIGVKVRIMSIYSNIGAIIYSYKLTQYFSRIIIIM